jgi:hypothetical protein
MNCSMCKREFVTEAYYKIINNNYCFRCAEKIHEDNLFIEIHKQSSINNVKILTDDKNV